MVFSSLHRRTRRSLAFALGDAMSWNWPATVFGGVPMWWIVASLVAVVALVLLNARPTRCLSCKRVNIFRRTKTGRRRDGFDEGGMRRRSIEYVCDRCASRYWIVWDDFDGCRASLSSGFDANAEPRPGRFDLP